MRNLFSILSVVMLLVLCGCSNDGMNDTYWRNDKTGDWLIGFVENKVVYDCKVWDVMSQTEENGAYNIQAERAGSKLVVNVGVEEDGKRTITINGKDAECSIISGQYLPDYPEKDTTAFADNNYRTGDSVTIVGWIKPMPAPVQWLQEKINGEDKMTNEVSVCVTNIFTNQEESFSAPLDSLGRFTLRMPMANTTALWFEYDGGLPTIVAEPNETYFLMVDPMTKKNLFMGKNARLQNEIMAHRIEVSICGTDSLGRMGGSMNILANIESKTKADMKQLDEMCKEHPTLSEKYKTFCQNEILSRNVHMLMQGMYLVLDYKLPEPYIKAVNEHYLAKMQEPYTMGGEDFKRFFKDYVLFYEVASTNKHYTPLQWIMDQAEQDGIIRLSAQDREAIRQCDAAYPAHREKVKNTPDSLRQALYDEFDKNDFMTVINDITSRKGYEEYARQLFTLRDMKWYLEEMEMQGWSQTVRDLALSNYLCNTINWTRTPLSKEILDLADATIQLQGAKAALHVMNDKYEQIGKRELNEDILKSNDVVKDMSDGEKILKKLIEPYKGKMILIDVWGTWCAPCKMRLAHSQEEYERLKPYDIVYMYFASSSEEKSWKNVIKEYNVTGDNVVHYNLPDDQQKALENYIGVQGYPTYKLIDQNGTLLDVNADPIDLDALAGLLERIKSNQLK